MTSLVFSLSFIVVALATSCFTLPIIQTETSTSFPVNLVDGHLPRAFNNEFDMFTSTLVTPLVQVTNAIPHQMSKKDNGANDPEDKEGSDAAAVHNEGVDERTFEELKDLKMTTMKTDGQVEHDERTFEGLKDLKMTTMKTDGQVEHDERSFEKKKDLEMTTIQNEGQVEHDERTFEENKDWKLTTMKTDSQVEHDERSFGVKKDLELTTMGIEGQSGHEQVDLRTRKFEETNTSQPEVVPADKFLVKVQTTVEKVVDHPHEGNDKFTSSTLIPQSSSSSSTKSSTKASEKFVGHYEDEEEKEKEKEEEMEKPKFPKKPIKESKNKKDKKDEKEESESESEEKKPKHPSAPLAEFVPNAFDSISTPPGNQLQFDENQQSIPLLTTEKSKEKESEVDEDSNGKSTSEKIVKKKKTIVNKFPKKPTSEDKLNQGEEPSIPEEEKPNH